MVEREKPVEWKIKEQKMSDPVYAVNKDGDFSKTSAREPEWPRDAEEKQDWNAINMGDSNGVKRFEDTRARVIQLGEVPRGFAVVSPVASNSDADNARGVVTLPKSEMLDSYEKRLKSLGDMVDRASNSVVNYPFPKERTISTDDNNKGAGVPTVPGLEVPTVFQEGKPLVKTSVLRNRELSTKN